MISHQQVVSEEFLFLLLLYLKWVYEEGGGKYLIEEKIGIFILFKRSNICLEPAMQWLTNLKYKKIRNCKYFLFLIVVILLHS
jgi:hypothetical protein